MNVFVEFALWFLLAEALVTLAGLPLRKKQLKAAFRIALIAGKALLAVLFAFLTMAGPVQLRAVQPLMTALYAALLMDALADAVCSAVAAIRKKERRFVAVRVAGLVLGALFVVYGAVNMETVKPEYHTYTSNKLQSEHTVVFIADLHVGSAQPFSVTEKTVAEVRALHPDATILGGDIVDDYTTKEEMEAAFRLFADFETPVYYVYGNHDRQGHAEYAGGRKFTPEELEKALEDNGIVLLRDSYVEVAPDLLILGREDLSEGDGRADIAALTNPAPEKYLIVADHQPNAFKDNLTAGADLQLSGHTHAGQLFPLGLLYPLIGYCRGDYAEGNAVMNVSPGACGWRFPMRTEAGCYYEVITLRPAA
ncbi:MAG: metallophosphoesterase [Clostridia bacterium]|nr:metallophosphoesterase [Clostridia bacterium]